MGVALACGLLGGARAQAPKGADALDVVVFTNGDRLTGKLESGAGDSIVFKSDMAGEIKIPLDKVKELHASGAFAVLRKDRPVKSVAAARAMVPGVVSYGVGKLTVERETGAGTPGGAEVVPEAQIANIIDAGTFSKETGGSTWREGWNGNVSGGATIVRATDYGETLSAGVALVRAMPQVSFLPARNRTTFNLQETYGKLTSPVIPQTAPPSAPAVTVTNIFHADAERDEYFSPRVYALGQTAFDHNYAQGLSLQQVYGGGIGWTVLKSDRQQLDVKGTAQYEMQQYLASSGTPNQNIVGSTLSEAYHRNLPRKLVFTEAVSALPAWNNTRDYSANGSVGLAMPVFKRLSLSITTTDNFLNDPAVGYNKNSYQFVTAVSYSLK
ncbi:MAG TPA: DUF481 domain-containing protein [Acidobacteriaceae bacterium]|nr:DUF481 domain-containing protein [Acidobacteriaceae bacterium]